MKKAVWIVLAVQILVMFCPQVLTWLAADSLAYMGMAMLILLIVHPLCSLGVGIFAGFDLKSRWWLLLSGALLALCGNWIFFSFETAFLFYAGLDLVLGVLGLTPPAVIQWSKQRER